MATVYFNGPREVVFSFVCDPTAWTLAGAPIDRITQRPITVGTTWTYGGAEYTCAELSSPASFSVNTGGVTIRLTFAATAGGSTVCALNVSGKARRSVAKTERRHLALLADLKKVFDGMRGSTHVSRITIESEQGRDGRYPALTVRTSVKISATATRVFDVVVGDPGGFWRWMVDRSKPGGLTIAPDWPRAGSSYTWCLPLDRMWRLRRWDTGTARIASVEPGRHAVLEEHQDDGNLDLRSTYTCTPGAGTTRFDSEYVVTLRGWRLRLRALSIFSFVKRQWLLQTANIAAVCEVLQSEDRYLS